MRWEDGRRSANVEDRRGGGGATRRGGGRRPRVAAPLGGGAILLAIVIYALTGDPDVALQVVSDSGGARSASMGSRGATDSPGSANPGGVQKTGRASEDELADFISVVLADTEDVWSAQFEKRGARYEPPRLVLFRDQVRSACGFQSSATGPFYCPGDNKAYIDLGFYDQLRSRFGAPGDFAQAYVLAHEVGHHVQNLTGTSARVHRARSGLSKEQGNQLSVMQELQADCYAGIWAHHAQAERQMLEAGDVDEGLRAAAAIGDDTLQRQARGFVSPESFTHGSAEQRQQWFATGLSTGSMESCDTFAGKVR